MSQNTVKHLGRRILSFLMIVMLLSVCVPAEAVEYKILTAGRARGLYKCVVSQSAGYNYIYLYPSHKLTSEKAGYLYNGQVYKVLESWGYDNSPVTSDGLYISWHHVVDGDLDGWVIASSEFKYQSPLTSSISFQNVAQPVNQTKGSGFTVKGTVNSEYNLKTVDVYFINASTGAMSSSPKKQTVSVSGKSVALYPTVDKWAWFAQIPLGTWKMVLVAHDELGGSKTFTSNAFTVYEAEKLSCWANVDRYSAYTGDTVAVTYGSNKAAAFYLHVRKDGADNCTAVSGGTSYYTFPSAGTYSIVVGAAYSSEEAESATYTVTVTDRDTQAPAVTEARIENVTSMGFDVVCSGTDNIGVSQMRIGTWHDSMSIDSAIWQSATGGSGVRFHVDVSNFGGAQNVTYHTNVYAIDTSGNYSAAVRAEPEPFVQAEPGDWIVAASLPEGVTDDCYDIEYRHTYTAVSASSPGDGWTRGSLNYSNYEPVGAPYESDMELAVSETRRLVSFYYYHYCGASHGVYADHTIRNGYVHWDVITDVNSVVEVHRQEDDTDAGYWAYILEWKTGGRAYCKSGVTCDGTYGTHGNRAYYWYRRSTYQDYQRVDYYNWSRTGDWTAQRDGSAASVMLRYKRRQIPVTEAALDSTLIDAYLSEGSAMLHCAYLPATAFPAQVAWASSNESVATVQDGAVTFLRVGAAYITCTIDDITAKCLVVVHADRQLVIPAGTAVIEADAFRGDASVEEVVLPHSIERIESGAFADCANLKLISGGSPNMQIAADAFGTSASGTSPGGTEVGTSLPETPGISTSPIGTTAGAGQPGQGGTELFLLVVNGGGAP